MAESGLGAAGEEGGAGWGAVGPGDVAAGAADAVAGEGVEIGGGDVAAAVEADVGVAHVVGDDDEDIRFGGGGSGVRVQGEEG